MKLPGVYGRPLTLMRSGLNEGRKVKWWQRLREGIGDSKDTPGSFYTLRHLGATEYGSRKG